jgi:two-component system KDP operon response regulator KdpE
MTPAQGILVVEDDPALRSTLTELLQSAGYRVNAVNTFGEALEAIGGAQPDLIVLDIGVFDADAGSLCSQLRERAPAPIIALSARDRNPEKVRAVEVEADDYVTKPFSGELMLSRVQGVLQRKASIAPSATGWVRYKGLSIDYGRHRVLRGRKEIRLTPKEFQLLALLAQKSGGLLTHSAILKAIWGPHAVDHPEHLWVLVAQLRRKIEVDPANPRYIVNEPWFGYRFASESID